MADCISRTQPAIAAVQVEHISLVFNPHCAPKTAVALSQQAWAAGYPLELIDLDELSRNILQNPAPAADLIGPDLGSG